MRHFILFATLSFALFMTACKGSKDDGTASPSPTDSRLANIKLPPGFHISIFAKDLDGPRSMALGSAGTVFFGGKGVRAVYALVDANHDGYAEKLYKLTGNMVTPNGIAYHNGALYIAQVDTIWRLDNIEAQLANPPAPVFVAANEPHNGMHGWKYIGFGPDGKLYVPVGAPCNICDSVSVDPRFASMTRMNSDGSDFEVFAHGIRNSVGFDWNPLTKELWFTDNGRDELGDDIPSDELNRAPNAGMHFGYPFCHQGDISDPIYGSMHPCSDFTPPVAKLGAHVASLGMKFYTGNMFPAVYKNQVFIAEHGSWNRTTPIGYRIALVRLSGNTATSVEVFADGWLQNSDAWGRPVDILQLKDGSLLVSDDKANMIYRITYQP
jgi:glucose/arabinose dehydrogenase